MTKKERADQLVSWWADPVGQDAIGEIRDAQIKVFTNPGSTSEEREAAHLLVRSIAELEAVVKRATNRAASEDKRQEHKDG